jgi:5'(3')-deoxyribonucleotidase
MNKKQRIAIDMDEVMADTIEKFAILYKRDHNIELNLNEMRGKEVRDALPPDLYNTTRKYVNEPGFFRDIPVMPDSQQVIRELYEKYEVFVVSAAMEFRNSLIDKYDWLAEHFPFIAWQHIMFCGLKIVNVDIFIDDRSRNFAEFNGRALLYSSPHNLLIDEFERVDNWQQVADKLL